MTVFIQNSHIYTTPLTFSSSVCMHTNHLASNEM